MWLFCVGRIMGITGPGNSGKTTFIVNFMETYPGMRYAVLKHDPKDKARLDTPGKDSYRFFHAGANVGIFSEKKTGLFFHHPVSVENLVASMRPFDLLFLEGLKENPYKKIGIFHREIQTSYLPYVSAIILRNPDPSIDLGNDLTEGGIPVFSIRDGNPPENAPVFADIREWIIQNASPE